MNEKHKLQADSMLLSLPSYGVLDEDLSSFISSLIDQNAALTRKLQDLNSLEELAGLVVAEAYKRAETIKSQSEEDANVRAAAITRESEEKAKLAANKILAEAKKKAEDIVEEKTNMAIREGLLIIQKAQDRALAILDEVEKQGQGITNWKRPSVGSSGFQQRVGENKVK